MHPFKISLFSDMSTVKSFRCIINSKPVIRAKSNTEQYQEYNMKVFKSTLKETETVLKKICDSLVPIDDEE